MPLHTHCDIKDWSSSAASTTITNPNAANLALGLGDLSTAGGSAIRHFSFLPILDSVPPPSTVPDCFYEISDITTISVTFTGTGTLEFDYLCLGGVLCVNPGDVRIDPVSPITFQSGVTRNLRFEPHLGVDPIEFELPDGTFPITFGVFLDPHPRNLVITAASISLSGHHYYVSEPSTLLLLLFGTILLVRRSRIC